VASLNDDASNVFLTLTARVLKADLAIYGKADDPATLLKLERAGANVQFSPALVAGQRVAHQIMRPQLTEVVAFSAGAEADDLGIEEVTSAARGRSAGRHARVGPPRPDGPRRPATRRDFVVPAAE
jgi:Trk K+ transport system NAD-binding subunit